VTAGLPSGDSFDCYLTANLPPLAIDVAAELVSAAGTQ
jgi:hypothetical protein